MPEQYPDIDKLREGHEAIVHLVELGVVYAYRSGDPFDPVFISASRIAADRCGSQILPAELRCIFQKFQRLIIARRN